VPAAALREQQLFIRRSGQRRRRPAGRPSPRRKLDLGGGILATCLRQHLGISAAALAPLIGADPRTVSEAIKDTGSLLAQAGHVIPPGPARCRTLNDLRGAPRVWWRLDSPQMLLSGWVVVFHGTAAWRNHDLIIFPLCFIEHLSSCAVQLPRLVAGCARQAAPGGLGISSSGTAHCAAGSPGWSRVTLQRHRLRRRRRP